MENTNEWQNYGDTNFAEYGGTLVYEHSNDMDFHEETYHNGADYEFFNLIVNDRTDTKYAFHGSISHLEDYLDENCIINAAHDFDLTPQEYIEQNPLDAVSQLVENYGHGVVEFSPHNNEGTGQYSMDYKDFAVTDRELKAFMAEVGIPSEYFPVIEEKEIIPNDIDFGDPDFQVSDDLRKADFYLGLDNFTNEELQEIIERSEILEDTSWRNIDLSSVNIYSVLELNGDAELVVSTGEKEVAVTLSSDEKEALHTAFEQDQGKTFVEFMEDIAIELDVEEEFEETLESVFGWEKDQEEKADDRAIGMIRVHPNEKSDHETKKVTDKESKSKKQDDYER